MWKYGRRTTLCARGSPSRVRCPRQILAQHFLLFLVEQLTPMNFAITLSQSTHHSLFAANYAPPSQTVLARLGIMMRVNPSWSLRTDPNAHART